MINIYRLFIIISLTTLAPSGFASQISTGSDGTEITFIKNNGQWPSPIQFQAVSTGINVYFLDHGLSFAQTVEEEDSLGQDIYVTHVWNMNFLNANSPALISGDSSRTSKVSYLIGSDTNNWVIHPPEFARLTYQSLYPDVDLAFYGTTDNLKYDYIVHPHGSVHAIINYFEGTQPLSINTAGELEVSTEAGTHVHKSPYSFQVINGVTHPVSIRYVILNDSTFGYDVTGSYDANYDLIIDPLFQYAWSTYAKAAGASNNINYCFSNTTDNNGNVYITGMVDAYYPVTAGAYSGAGSVAPEIFISKFSPNGTTLIYSTYISGSSVEMGLSIAADNLGRAYITGHAMANWTGSNTYPTTASAYQPAIYPAGGYDAIFTVLNPLGTGLVYSTFLGGAADDEGYAIALGDAGKAYITGYTYSPGNTFPVKGASSAQQQSAQGYHDAFVAKFDINLTGLNSLVYSIHLGGGGDECGRAIAVNSSGSAYVTGYTQEISPPSFPLTAGNYSSSYNGGYDNRMVFVTKLSSSTPVTASYSTYLGPGTGNGITLDATGNAYVTGATSTFSFPVTASSLQHLHGQDVLGNPNSDAFITKLNAAGNGLVYSTFLGGPGPDLGEGIAVNAIGEAYVSGMASPQFPTSPGGLQPNHSTGGGDADFFVAHLNISGSAYSCGGSTFIGGNDVDYNSSMYDYPSPKISMRDHYGVSDTVLISGTSHSTNFPTTPGSYSPNKLNGIADQPVFFELTCAAVLPVSLIEFTGEEKGKGINLKWTTASETDNDNFIVERSPDSRVFAEIGRMSGHGNSTSLNNYEMLDMNPFDGINYYRLVQVDFDGTEKTSKVIAISVDKNDCRIYYDQTSDKLIIACPDGEFLAELISQEGKVIVKHEASGFTSFDMQQFTKGIYLLRMQNSHEVKSFRIIKP